MWITLLALSAWGDTATLHVAVHRQAGEVYDIAADGADGLCTAGPAYIRCPASGPVRFRWAGGDHFALTGDVEVGPGEVGVAFVLATDELREPERARLAAEVTPESVYSLFAPAPGIPAPVPSPGMVADLARLAGHPDPLVRRAVVDALVPFWRHTSSDPFPPEAPELLPTGLISELASDSDTRVRRRLAAMLKELRNPDVSQAAEAEAALLRLIDDPKPPVQRAATNSLRFAVAEGEAPALQTWEMAMVRARRDGPPGRAASNTLAWLSRELEPGPDIKPEDALAVISTHHLERSWEFWYAWRAHLDYEHDKVFWLLLNTVGLHRGLLRYWARTSPADLAVTLSAWEPAAPHSKRFLLIRTWLDDTEHPELRGALELPAL